MQLLGHNELKLLQCDTSYLNPGPADKRRKNNAIITPKRRRLDVIMTLSLRHVSVGATPVTGIADFAKDFKTTPEDEIR